MLASNHISWLDIFVINAVMPATFVSKADVAKWPLVGWLCTRAGTLYIERGSKSGARRANQNISSSLASGALVTVDNQIDTTTGTVKLRAQFANPENVLFPNQFVNIQVLVDTKHDVVVAPSA